MAFERAELELAAALETTDPILEDAAEYLSREYVWGPGDGWGGGGVDELLAQYAGSSPDLRAKPWWALQDGEGDVVALCERAMTGDGGVSDLAGSLGCVLGQTEDLG